MTEHTKERVLRLSQPATNLLIQRLETNGVLSAYSTDSDDVVLITLKDGSTKVVIILY